MQILNDRQLDDRPMAMCVMQSMNFCYYFDYYDQTISLLSTVFKIYNTSVSIALYARL